MFLLAKIHSPHVFHIFIENILSSLQLYLILDKNYMDILLISLGIILTFVGIAGCIIPGLPGTPLNFLAVLFLHWTSYADYTIQKLLLYGVIAIAIYLIDVYLPIWGTKKYGGSKKGIWGSIIGLLVGMIFFPPFGIIIGPFAGAVVGELIEGKDNKAALRSGFGAFLGFITGTGLKLAGSGWLTWIFFRDLFS